MGTPSIYLDTCVISGWAEAKLAPDELTALGTLLEWRKAGRVDLATSAIALKELLRIPEQHHRRHLDVYEALREVPLAADWRRTPPFRPTDGPHGRTDHRLLEIFTRLMPDRPDAEHVFHALSNGIDFVATVDRRTMLKHAEAIETQTRAKVRLPSVIVSVLSGPATTRG
jgi:hypothetical protein